MFIIMVYDCTLHDRIGIKVGRLQLGSRGQWSVYDPIARAFCKSVGQVSYEGVAKVDASKPGHFGEFEFHDPRALLDYLAMPERVHNIEQDSEKIGQMLRKLLKTDKSAVPNHGVA